MVKQSKLDDVARRAAAESWGVAAATVTVSDASASFAWCKSTTPFVAAHRERGRALVWVTPESAIVIPQVRERAPITPRLERANAVLGGEDIALPQALPPDDLAFAIRNLLGSLGGVIATDAFLQGADPRRAEVADPEHPEPIDLWTRTGSKIARALFRKLCEAPKLLCDGDRWSLRFSAFIPSGAVERWVVSGDTRGLTDARCAEVVGAATFLYPYG